MCVIVDTRVVSRDCRDKGLHRLGRNDLFTKDFFSAAYCLLSTFLSLCLPSFYISIRSNICNADTIASRVFSLVHTTVCIIDQFFTSQSMEAVDGNTNTGGERFWGDDLLVFDEAIARLNCNGLAPAVGRVT